MAIHTPSTLDPAKSISPELVLVSPELREAALARGRRFPTPVPRASEPLRRVARDEPVAAIAPATRPGRGLAFPLRAAAGAAVVAAVIVGTVALLSTTRDAPSLEPLTHGRGVATTARGSTSAGTTSRPARERSPHARAATPKKSVVQKTSRPRTARPKRATTATVPPAVRRLARRAERNVLNSPLFFVRLGARGSRFVDPATQLFRSRVSIRCSQLRVGTHLSCIVRRGNASLAVLYLRTSAHSFRLVHR